MKYSRSWAVQEQKSLSSFLASLVPLPLHTSSHHSLGIWSQMISGPNITTTLVQHLAQLTIISLSLNSNALEWWLLNLPDHWSRLRLYKTQIPGVLSQMTSLRAGSRPDQLYLGRFCHSHWWVAQGLGVHSGMLSLARVAELQEAHEVTSGLWLGHSPLGISVPGLLASHSLYIFKLPNITQVMLPPGYDPSVDPLSC